MIFPEELRAFVVCEKWTYAKTMPDWPHEYIVRERVDQSLFERTVIHIRANGYVGHFYSKEITYYDDRYAKFASEHLAAAASRIEADRTHNVISLSRLRHSLDRVA